MLRVYEIKLVSSPSIACYFIKEGIQTREEFPIGTVGGAAASPTLRFATPTLCFATPTCEMSGCLALKRCCFTVTMQNCQICRHFGMQALVFKYHSRTCSQWTIWPHQLFSEKLHPWIPACFVSQYTVWGKEDINDPLRISGNCHV